MHVAVIQNIALTDKWLENKALFSEMTLRKRLVGEWTPALPLISSASALEMSIEVTSWRRN